MEVGEELIKWPPLLSKQPELYKRKPISWNRQIHWNGPVLRKQLSWTSKFASTLDVCLVQFGL